MKLALFCLAPLVTSACVETKDPIVGTQSLKIDLKTPTGDEMNPLTDYMVTVDVSALDADGELDTSYERQVQVYVNFLGTLTPYLGGPPLATVQMTAGKANNQTITLPRVFGPATLWFDDGTSENPTYATGASPTLWYRDPFIDDIQRPTNEMALDALSKSPLETKQVTVNASRHGENGRLVVTSVFAQGYTVSDVLCGPGGAPPCTVANNPALTPPAPGYDHKMVFSFSAPADERGRPIQEGQIIQGFAGGVSEFNGLTEIGFPQTFVEGEPDVDAARIPAPAEMDSTWFQNKYMFERNEAAPIAIINGKVCDLDQDYATYKQWKVDPAGVGGNCTGNRSVINVISTGVIATDPMTLVGKTLPRVVGVLRPVNIGSFNVWIIYPRGAADLQLQ